MRIIQKLYHRNLRFKVEVDLESGLQKGGRQLPKMLESICRSAVDCQSYWPAALLPVTWTVMR